MTEHMGCLCTLTLITEISFIWTTHQEFTKPTKYPCTLDDNSMMISDSFVSKYLLWTRMFRSKSFYYILFLVIISKGCKWKVCRNSFYHLQQKCQFHEYYVLQLKTGHLRFDRRHYMAIVCLLLLVTLGKLQKSVL